ncbi:MAG TPA: PhzF family phenazine biosynthesis protein [Flavitalea sp.]|nr:PhzF family phenazine biosynthesis protein [Flavitalea sp.]
MNLTIYQVDAFTKSLFGGNPAAIIPLSKWVEESLLQKIAMENNVSETAYFVPAKNGYDIRWFTPGVEINLCGHATLASAFILYEFMGYEHPSIHFHSKSGELIIRKDNGMLMMDFPSWMPTVINDIPAPLKEGLQSDDIISVHKNRDVLVEVKNAEAVRKIKPDFRKLKEFGNHVIVTARGDDCDFVSRFFAPAAAIDEDPVTGSAHSQLIPYWAAKLGKQKLFARQLSSRGGEVWCENVGDRVKMGGYCTFYMKGELEIS